MDAGKVTLASLQQMKRDGRKIVGVMVYDYQMAQIADRAGVDLVSVGDSVGVNLWGHASESEMTLNQMVLVCQAVRRGVTRALVSCDVPLGPLQEGALAGTSIRDGIEFGRVRARDLSTLSTQLPFHNRKERVEGCGGVGSPKTKA